MRQKSHTSLVQKGWVLKLKKPFLTLIYLLILIIGTGLTTSYTPADYQTTTTNVNNPIFQVRVNNVWQPLSIKYGLIMEGGTLKYSSELKGNKFYYSNSFAERQSTATTIPTLTTTIKFNVSTIIPDNAIGFFYEFSTGSEGLYYAKKDMIVYPNKWHIYYDDLIKHYGKDNVVVENNRILIYNVPGGKLFNFDPEGGGDGIPTDCTLDITAMYNVTNVFVKEVINMSLYYDYSGICNNIGLGWYDNTTGTRAQIPSAATDLSCTGATCTQTPATKRVWYNKSITCESPNATYYVMGYVRYDDSLGVTFWDYTTSQVITCLSAPNNISLYYPANNTEYCSIADLFFQVNVTAPPSQSIHNITLYIDPAGVWKANNTWYQHFINSSSTMTILYFNNSNKTYWRGLSPMNTYTNKSLNMESGLLGDRSLNFSNKTGRISYNDALLDEDLQNIVINITYGTICFWFMPYETYGLGTSYLFYDYADTNENLLFYYSGLDTDWAFKKEHLNNNYVLYTTMNNKPKKYEWLMMCFSWDNDYTGIYVNGSLRASSTGRLSPTTIGGHFELGGTQQIKESCNCVIDEFVIFDRRLSDTQISNLYLSSNRTMNFSIGKLPVGSYQWNAKAVYFSVGNYNYSNFNSTFIVSNCQSTCPYSYEWTRNPNCYLREWVQYYIRK